MKTRIQRLTKKLHLDRGFTLVELLVTVTIIGILAAVVTVGVSGAASNSQVKANQALFQGYQSLIDAWLAANPQITPETQVPTHLTFTTSNTFTCQDEISTGAGAGCDASGTSFRWYTATGDASTARTLRAALNATTTVATYVSIDPTSTDGLSNVQFRKFFRLGNSATTTLCIVSNTAKNNVLACKN